MNIDPAAEPEHGPGPVPDDTRTESRITRLFEEANDRASTPAERRLLRTLAADFDDDARSSGLTGWDWLALAIDDAVAAGSAFVAPRRIREILARWQRDGLPAEYALTTPDRQTQSGTRLVTQGLSTSHRSTSDATNASVGEDLVSSRDVRSRVDPAGRRTVTQPEPVAEEASFVPPVFTIAACGMTNRQVWAAALADLQFSGAIGRADISTWLRAAAVLAATDDGTLTLGVPHDLARRRAAGRYLPAIRQSVASVTGIAYTVEIILFRDWPG